MDFPGSFGMTRRRALFGGLVLAVQQNKLEDAIGLIESQTRSGFVGASVLRWSHRGAVTERAFGKARDPKAVFLLASITKPMTVTGLMILADRGDVSLDHRVDQYIPEFRGAGRERVLVRHLLNHTSGLPDMLPENVELRKRHAPLADFVKGACQTPLLFTPGSQVSYQSMGILLAAEIVQRVAKQPLPQFLMERVYGPLQMKDTSLGLGGRALAQTMLSQVPERSDWDWNSVYWRNLGAPWGGALAPAEDVARFLEYFAHPDDRVLKPATAQSMIENHTPGLKQRWGWGWSLNGPRFGRGCSEGTYGHSGSTGTLCWLDRQNQRSFVLLTTRPADESNKPLIQPASELLSEA